MKTGATHRTTSHFAQQYFTENPRLGREALLHCKSYITLNKKIVFLHKNQENRLTFEVPIEYNVLCISILIIIEVFEKQPMEQLTLYVRMLGTLSITLNDVRIGCDSGRGRQPWLILAYMIHHRSRIIPSDELISLLHLEEKGVNPAGALKTAMHRVRTLLNQLGEQMGHTILQSKENGYCLSPDINMDLDTETFEAALAPNEPPDTDLLLRALNLYSGGFCAAFADEEWVIPLAAYYQNLYARGVQNVALILETENRYSDCANLCRQAIRLDPYREVFFQLLMRSLLALGQREQVITVYENMSKLMLSAIGVMPDQESRALYREALRTVSLPKITAAELTEQLKETSPIKSALLCDFDFFRNVYQAQARLLARSGESVHIVLMNVTGRSETSRRNLENTMNQLELQLCQSLRKGDVVTRCSATQFVIMLPHADYDNSCKVCRRLVDALTRKCSGVKLDCYVQAITPADI